MPETTDTDTQAPVSRSVTPLLNLALSADGKEPAFRFSATGIVIRENLSEEEWVDGLNFFKWGQKHMKMGFAEYVAYGSLKFGKDTSDKYLHQLEFDLLTVTQAISINSVPPEIRHPNLRDEHYVVIGRAKLKKPEQVKWAKVAVAQQLTPAQLKTSIAMGEVVSTSTSRHQTSGILSIHGIRAEFDIWLRRVDGVDGVLKQPPANVQEILNEIKVIRDFYNDVELALKSPKKKKRPIMVKKRKK